MSDVPEKWISQNLYLKRPLPPEPTHHLPGTPGKEKVMMERLEQGFHLHHPDDARVEEESLDIPLKCLVGHPPGPRLFRMEGVQ